MPEVLVTAQCYASRSATTLIPGLGVPSSVSVSVSVSVSSSGERPRSLPRLLGCGFGQFLGGPCGQVFVDLGNGDDLVDRTENAFPAATDDLGDVVPALAAGFTLELLDAPVDVGQSRIAVEELADRRQFADRADRRDDGQCVGDLLDGIFGGLLCEQPLDTDQVELMAFIGVEAVCRGFGELGQCGVVREVVVGVGAHECHQVGGALETEEVVVLAQETLPLVGGVAPARGPQ